MGFPCSDPRQQRDSVYRVCIKILARISGKESFYCYAKVIRRPAFSIGGLQRGYFN